MISRRTFLERSSLALAGMTGLAMAGLKAIASESNGGALTGPLGRPVGLQLYTVREDAARDLVGTLTRIAAIGYREVETAGFYNKSPRELRALFDDVGLAAPSAHYSMADLQKGLDAKIDYAAELGVKYFVCSFPALPGGNAALPAAGAGRTIANSITLDHWKWNAEQLNRIGALTQKAGIRTGYHNHNMEFRSYGGAIAFDQLMKWTDPALVTFELDLGWVVTAGADPVAYLKNHAERIALLHVKDVRKDATTVADELRAQTIEVGRGKIDWQRVFAAADPKHLQHYFVEQENFERPALESVRMSYEYLRGLGEKRMADSG